MDNVQKTNNCRIVSVFVIGNQHECIVSNTEQSVDIIYIIFTARDVTLI
jgi:hypothetical protein